MSLPGYREIENDPMVFWHPEGLEPDDGYAMTRERPFLLTLSVASFPQGPGREAREYKWPVLVWMRRRG